MKKINYSKYVDALLVELSEEFIAYGEEERQVILHYSKSEPSPVSVASLPLT